MLILALIATVASAEGPLAIPPSPTIDAPQAQAAPLTMSAALADYRRRAVAIHQFSTLAGGGSFVGWGMGWPGFGSPYMGMSSTVYLGGPVYEVPHWTVVRGGQRLTVPQWMDVADVPEARDSLGKQVRRTKRWHQVCIGLAVAGGAAVVGTALGSQTAQTYEEYDNWRLGTSLGTALTVGSVAGAYGTGMRARSLRYDFDATQELGQTRQWVRDHNSKLRDELHLSPAQTAAIDRGE